MCDEVGVRIAQNVANYEEGIVIVPKTYDVFISHSSGDKAIAEKIAHHLIANGLQVWYDDWEILVGHDIVDKVYDGIRNSRFLLVLLSEKSVRSNWVQQEINAARIREIESGATIVLPAIIEHDARSHIPESLRTKRYADISADFESAMKEIEYAVSVTKLTPVPIAPPPARIPSTYEAALAGIVSADLNAYGWKQNEAFFRVAVGPNGPPPRIPKQDLENIINSSTVRIAGYGGAGFPYDQTFPDVTNIHHADGFGTVDVRAWPYEDWSFHYWYFNQLGYFVTHRHLSEDHMLNIPRRTLSVEWLQLDVARSVLFARKLQTNVQDYPEARIGLLLHGMKNRELIILNRRRMGFFRGRLVSSDDDIEAEATLAKDADVIRTGLELLLDIVWRFGWRTLSEEALRNDMTTLCSGRFPD